MKIFDEKKIYIESTDSYYTNLIVILKSYNDYSCILHEKGKYNGIFMLERNCSEYNVFVNAYLFDKKPLELEIAKCKLEMNNQYIFSVQEIKYQRYILENVVKGEYNKWWEENIKNVIHEKYEGLNNATNMCQFARQLRNAFAHGKISIDKKLKAPFPIWNNINLLNHNGKQYYDILSTADIIQFWYDFEMLELK